MLNNQNKASSYLPENNSHESEDEFDDDYLDLEEEEIENKLEQEDLLTVDFGENASLSRKKIILAKKHNWLKIKASATAVFITAIILLAFFLLLFFSTYPFTTITKDVDYILIAFAFALFAYFFAIYFSLFYKHMWLNRDEIRQLKDNNRLDYVFKHISNLLLIFTVASFFILLIFFAFAVSKPMHSRGDILLAIWCIVFATITGTYCLFALFVFSYKSVFKKSFKILNIFGWVCLILLIIFCFLALLVFGIEVLDHLNVIPGKALFIVCAIWTAISLLSIAGNFRQQLILMFPMFYGDEKNQSIYYYRL